MFIQSLNLREVNNLRGKAIWVLGFFSFLAGLNAIVAVILSINFGIEGTFQPYLLDSLTGGLPIYAYLIGSIIVTLIFLAAATSKLVTELSNIPLLSQINTKANKLEQGQKLQQDDLENLKGSIFVVANNLDATKKEITKRFTEQDNEIKLAQTSLTNKINKKLTQIKAEIETQLTEGFGEQAEMLKEFHTSLTTKFTNQSTQLKAQIENQLTQIDATVKTQEQTTKKTAKAIQKQKDEITNIQTKLTNLENQFVQPQPQLTSQSNPEKIRGIGPTTAKELTEMGITTVGQLIMEDPKVIAEKTSTTQKTVQKLQGIAQLSMVPAVTEKNIILLEEAGIPNRKELANQDPIELSQKINKIFKTQQDEGKMEEADKPTIEQIQSWIKNAKT